MLTRVVLGQVRFTLPGLAADARGVALGRELAVRFATLDRAVAFLRVLSGDRLPDELWHQLRLAMARTLRGPRELVALLPSASTHVADVVARAARLAGGQCFTGAGRHFVPYRDPESPLGYDTALVSHEPADFVLYTGDGSLHLQQEGQTTIEELLLRLDLRRTTRGPLDGQPLYLSVRRGLGAVLFEYLHRSGVEAAAALCEPDAPSAFGGPASFWLIRVASPPRRMLQLLSSCPGLRPFVPASDRIVVTAGYEHPVHLEGCGAALAPGRFYLFQPPPDRVLVLPEAPPLVPIADLVRLRLPAIEEPAPQSLRAGATTALQVPLRVASSPSQPARAKATWIPWPQVPWLRRVCYALPASALQGYRAAVLDGGVLVVAPTRLEGFPFGQLLDEPMPGVLLPVGSRLQPAISPDLLRERLGVTEGAFVVFPSYEGRPFRVPASAIDHLERRLLGTIESLGIESVRTRGAWLSSTTDERPPEIEHEPLGLMPLWGLSR
jgi:hypothetical protein